MEELIGEIFKGFFRGIGYILAELFFGFVCYWTGWPFCKIITMGRYPKASKREYFEGEQSSDVWCSLLGLCIWLFAGLYFLGAFN
jgi:hypothetical protein